MNRVFNRYRFLFVVLLCTFNAGNSFAGSTEILEKNLQNHSENEQVSINLAHLEISPKEDHQANLPLTTVIEYEKSDEEESSQLGVQINSNPISIFNRVHTSTGSYLKSVQKSAAHPARFVWNLHSSRCVIFQVFRV